MVVAKAARSIGGPPSEGSASGPSSAAVAAVDMESRGVGGARVKIRRQKTFKILALRGTWVSSAVIGTRSGPECAVMPSRDTSLRPDGGVAADVRLNLPC